MSKCPKRLEYILHNLWPPSTRYFNMKPWNQLRVHGKRYDMKGRGKVVIGNQIWRWGVLCRASYLPEVEWTRNDMTNMKQDQVSPTPQIIEESYPFLPYFPLSLSLSSPHHLLFCVSLLSARGRNLFSISHTMFSSSFTTFTFCQPLLFTTLFFLPFLNFPCSLVCVCILELIRGRGRKNNILSSLTELMWQLIWHSHLSITT